MTLAINKASHRVQSSSSNIDPSGLGRWSSILFRGSHGVTLRAMTAYRVCNQHAPGPNTAASQHHRYMLSQGDTRHSRDAILQDLATAVTQYHDEGEQVIVMMDCNEDVRSPSIKAFMRSIGLKEAITNGREEAAQATHSRNCNLVPIDGCFISLSLQMHRGGYLPFDAFGSDHRGLWFDIFNDNLFGFKIRDVPRHQARRMKCDLPWVKQKFIHDYKQLLREANLYQRIYYLQTLAQNLPWDESMSRELNTIMEIRERSILLADSKCRKLCMGGVDYSDSYDRIITVIELWKGVVKRKSGKRFSNTKIRRLARKAGIDSPNMCTLEEAISKRNQAFKEYYTEVKPNAAKLRTTFLEKKAIQQATAGNKDFQTVLKQLQDREQIRKANRRIDWTLEKHKGTGVTKISIEDQRGVTRDITDQRGIERECMKEFERKFRQTEGTQSMQEPWLSILGYDGKTQGAQDILDGTLLFPVGTSEYTRNFIHELRREPIIRYPAPLAVMETSSFQQGWKQMKEQTSAGISGITFGHMKACAEDGELSNFEATVSHLPYSTGFVPESWKRGVCCMLPKKANSDKVTDLRTIVLQECEYNFNNKKLGKDAMRHAEKNNFIAPEQYGSRKGKRSIDHVLNKRLSYDLIRFSRRPGALCSNDAKSCYDRVLHSIVSIAFRRLGFPEPPIDCMINCIQQMKYFIRTTFGTSSDSFGSRHTAIPLMGLLQGNGAGPTIWVLVSTPLLNMLRTANHGAHLLSAISQEAAHFVGFAFVDDTDLVTFRADDFTITDDEIFDDMQVSIDRWEEGLRITGGAIVPAKSWVYPIAFEFLDDGRWRYKTMAENDYQFSVKDHTGIRRILQQFEVDIGKKTLGAILAPDGNNKEAVQSLRSTAERWHALVKTGHLQPDETFLATRSRVMKSVSYSLAAMTFTKKECNYILAPILLASLPKSHVSGTFPRDVVFGPLAEMGLGHSDLYTMQGVSHLNTIVHYLPMQDDITGQLIRHNLEAARVDIGLGGDFLMYDYATFSRHCTDSWVKCVWKFIDCHEISFTESVTSEQTLKRENDKVIMFHIIQLDKYGTTDLLRINACRLYLQAYSLSDLITGDGNRFTMEAWGCERDKTRRSLTLWPTQPRPNMKSRALWKQALKLAFSRHIDKTLHSPLGGWQHNPSRQIWTWFFNQELSAVYRRFGNAWKRYKRRTHRGQLGQFPPLIYDTDSLSLPPHSMRATVESKNGTLRLTGWGHESDQQYINPLTLQERYDQSVHRSVLAMHTDYRYFNCTEDDIVRQLHTGTISLVSDGSYLKDVQFATAAWVISITRDQYKVGRHYVTGNARDQCSHRAELSGLLGGILDLNAICLAHDIDNGQGNFYCDGLGAVSIASYIQHKLSPSHAHFDLIFSLFRAIKTSTLTWTFHHVYGHQDEGISLRELSDEAYYNTLADDQAKRKLTEGLRFHEDPGFERPHLLPYRLCYIQYRCNDGTSISIDSKFSNTLTNLIHTAKIQSYWVRRGIYPPYTPNGFNRTIAGRAMKSLSGNKRRWITKWCTGILGTGVTLQRWKQQAHSLCPRCKVPNETALHCILCQHHSANALWMESISELHDWMLSTKGQPDLVDVFCSSLTSWRNNLPFDGHHIDPDLSKVLDDQHTLGWERLFYGIWSHQWILLQQQYLSQLGSRKSALLWFAKIQHRLWNIVFDLWDQRNHVLHVDNNSIHPHELTAINGELIQAMLIKDADLPISQRYLFHGTAQSKLHWTISMKIQWLISVRRAKIHFYPLRDIPLPVWHDTVTLVLKRWCRKGNVEL